MFAPAVRIRHPVYSGLVFQFAGLTGNYTNNSNRDVMYITVVATFYDVGGKLVAAKISNSTLDGGRLAPGGTGRYEIYMLPDPEASTSGWRVEIRVVGNVND